MIRIQVDYQLWDTTIKSLWTFTKSHRSMSIDWQNKASVKKSLREYKSQKIPKLIQSNKEARRLFTIQIMNLITRPSLSKTQKNSQYKVAKGKTQLTKSFLMCWFKAKLSYLSTSRPLKIPLRTENKCKNSMGTN